MFCDETSISVQAGKGGDGLISFYRTKYVPKGGPDGGDGGRGGDVLLVADANMSTLSELHTKKKFQAEHGEGGKANDAHGRNGEDLILLVPMGTRIIDAETKEILADLAQNRDTFVAAVGGRGGYGNAHFTTSVRQAPRFAELGEPGESREMDLEVQLVADLGVIGLPSAGKSTFLSAITKAKPKIGPFPFTTIVPNLGVAELSNKRTLLICDLPGLIEKASEGKGLGHQFLRHTNRNRILLHFLDISSEDMVADYHIIRKELEAFDPNLAKKEELVVFTKCDLVGEDLEFLEEMRKSFSKATKINKEQIFFLSSATHFGTKELLEACYQKNMQEKEKEKKEMPAEESERRIFHPHLQKNPKSFTVEKELQEAAEGDEEERSFTVRGQRIEQISIQTDYNNKEGLVRLKDVFRKMGIEKELKKLGAKRDDPIHVGSKSFPFDPKIL